MNYLAQSYLDTSRDLNPNKTAVVCSGSNITYEELYNQTNKLGNCLKENGISRQDRVVFCLNRSAKCIIAIFGILKSDAIYVPIDPKSPLKRWRKIIEDCSPKAIICDLPNTNNMINVIRSMHVLPKLIIMEYRNAFCEEILLPAIYQEEVDGQIETRPKYANIDIDIAYILYTSGSTGNPKGVMISHLNILNYIEWAVSCFEITEMDNVLSTAPFHFDMSTFDIYCPIKTSSTLCIASESYLLFPGKLLTFIEEHGVTIWKGVSSLLMYLARTGALKKDRIQSLKRILFGGEVLPTKYLIKWMEIYPDKIFVNVYGPTEATGISTYFFVKQIPANAREPIPIGQVCENTDAIILKDNGSLAELGEIGELCIRGSSLSRGYWNDTEKTKLSFIDDPTGTFYGDKIYRTGDLVKIREDKNFIFIHRKDSQIKHMGYRIEPSEIERAISSLDIVDDAAVILFHSKKYDMMELIAFFEARKGISSEDILGKLSDKVPKYMLPQHIFSVANIPRTDRGKIDRSSLLEYCFSCLE